MPDSAVRAFFLPRASIGGALHCTDAGARSVHKALLRTALISGCAISISLAAYLGDPDSFIQADPSLARLLRGMAVIKGVIAIAAAAAVLWRFGKPVSKPAAASYLLGSWLLVGSTMLIWQLSWIAAAAVLFHAAGLSMLFVSWRDS